MFHHFPKYKKKIRDWAARTARGPYAAPVLFLISFAESSFFPIPPDFFLTPLTILDRKRWVRYATVTVVGSTLGALFGYAIGALLFGTLGERIIDFYGLQDEMVRVSELFDDHAFLTMFTAAFTFLPFKVFTISAGIFNINLGIFILASLIGRGVRFYVEAFLMYRYGEKIGKAIYKYFALFMLVVIVALVLAVIFI